MVLRFGLVQLLFISSASAVPSLLLPLRIVNSLNLALICYQELLLTEGWLFARCIFGLQSAHCRQDQGQDLWQGCKRRLLQQAEGYNGYDHPTHRPERRHMLAFGIGDNFKSVIKSKPIQIRSKKCSMRVMRS